VNDCEVQPNDCEVQPNDCEVQPNDCEVQLNYFLLVPLIQRGSQRRPQHPQ